LFIYGRVGKPFVRLLGREKKASGMTTAEASPPPRMLHMLPPTYRVFWTSGEHGRLCLLRSKSTGRWMHPFWPVSEADPDLVAEPVSGDGRVFTFTINQHPYNPQVPPPYVIAIVQLPEQDDLRIATNIVNCAPDDVYVGMPVRVRFEPNGGLFVPVFAPVTS
jgi:uncharacterized OB-fold protein